MWRWSRHPQAHRPHRQAATGLAQGKVLAHHTAPAGPPCNGQVRSAQILSCGADGHVLRADVRHHRNDHRRAASAVRDRTSRVVVEREPFIEQPRPRHSAGRVPAGASTPSACTPSRSVSSRILRRPDAVAVPAAPAISHSASPALHSTTLRPRHIAVSYAALPPSVNARARSRSSPSNHCVRARVQSPADFFGHVCAGEDPVSDVPPPALSMPEPDPLSVAGRCRGRSARKHGRAGEIFHDFRDLGLSLVEFRFPKVHQLASVCRLSGPPFPPSLGVDPPGFTMITAKLSSNLPTT